MLSHMHQKLGVVLLTMLVTASAAGAQERGQADVPGSAADYNTVQKIYVAHKETTDCNTIRRIAERLTAYVSNLNLVPEDKTYTVRYPTTKPQPTIADLAKDRELRIREEKAACFAQ